MLWDLFCRVIDNHGDIGVCWRLATALAGRGLAVRLWVDDPSALAWLAPDGAPGVTVVAWTAAPPDLEPGAVVVEAFGCAPPPGFVARMAGASPAPVWINLEYLSAEPYVERSHGLASPQFAGPGAGLTTWFFYPGFTPATGGLIRGRDELADLGDPDAPPGAAARAWATARGWGTRPGERSATLFCYANPALPALLQALADQPTLLRVPPGPAQAQLQALSAAGALPAGLRWTALPHLAQADFDRLLAAADVNLVRGEDSFVRAQCGAAAPWLWQIYPQHDGAHGPKLQAFLDLYLAGQPPALADALRSAFLAINGLLPADRLRLPETRAWRALQRGWRHRLAGQVDLVTQLLDFAAAKRR